MNDVGSPPEGPMDFPAVFRALYPQARRIALRILGSVPDAEDAAAEALARALADWSRVGRLSYRDAWVMRVTANVAIDATRKRAPTPNPAADTSSEEMTVLRLTLVSALQALPRRQREAVVLRHMAGYSEPQVAAALGVSVNTVKKHAQRGMARLRSSLSSEEGASLVFD